jgi:aminopeptidase N
MIQQAKRIYSCTLIGNLFYFISIAQPVTPVFTRADTLRGSMNAERAYNVIKYDIVFEPDYENKSIQGKNTITYTDSGLRKMQIDLQVPLEIDSIVQDGRKLVFVRDGNAFHVEFNKDPAKKPCFNCSRKLTVYYHGHPQIAKHAPWDGGFVFTKDSLGRPWISVACEGTGASVWYPCKDYLGDEPDSGASLTMVVADSLIAIGNGRLTNKVNGGKGKTTWTWVVTNPINNYNIIP